MNILLIDDEPDVRKSLSGFLSKLGHAVACASDGLEGLKAFHSHDFDLVITDIRMPGMDGLELLRRIKTVEKSPVDVIVVTAHGDMENAIKALKYGAYDYMQKPIDVRELAIAVDRAIEYSVLRESYISLKKEFRQRVQLETRAIRGEAEHIRAAYLEEIGLGNLCIYSDAMRRVIEQAEMYSTDRSTAVLIQGESGTGKELVARYIHYYTAGSASHPFVPVNCAAFARDLFEGELFGHEPGAYTGATKTGRMGKIEAAAGGTLFLDEIGAMPLDLQVKLLRVLEDKKFYRLGGIKEIAMDVRILSAANQDLAVQVKEEKFRLDLFYRINVGSIHIPPLRERKEDILPLALHFIKRAFARRGRVFGGFTGKAEEFLVSFSWPGNVRQLKNAMERLALLGSWDPIDLKDLSWIQGTNPADELAPGAKPLLGRDGFELPEEALNLEELNREIIKKALDKNQGNQTRTAQYLGISRRALQGRLKKMGLP